MIFLTLSLCVCVMLCFPQEWQRKLSELVPEEQRLTEKLRNISLNKISSR